MLSSTYSEQIFVPIFQPMFGANQQLQSFGMPLPPMDDRYVLPSVYVISTLIWNDTDLFWTADLGVLEEVEF